MQLSNSNWYTIIKWDNHVLSVDSHSKRPLYWVEYPLKDECGEPYSIRDEARVVGKRLEHARYLLHEAVHMTARPPWLVINDSMTEMGEIALHPDGVTVMDSGNGPGSATGDIRKLSDLTNASQ
ncbi:hypothetical protein MHBO_005222, partial [Bonamia ostreae]